MLKGLNKQSKIPRLSQASVDRIPQPKKYLPDSDYKVIDAEQDKPQIKRSQSFMNNKLSSSSVVNQGGIKNARKVVNSAAKPIIQDKDNTRRSSNYKPYTLREYKEIVDSEQQFTYKKRGGLGANIGGDEWQKQNEKRKRMKEFASRVKHQSKLAGDGMRRTSQTQNNENREK